MDNFSPVMAIAPERSALIVVDVQRYFVRRDYPYGKWIAQFNEAAAQDYFDRVESTVLPNIQRLQEAFRTLQAQVVYTEFGSIAQDGRDMPGWARQHNDQARSVVGSAVYPPFSDASCRVDDSVAPQAGELVVQKSTSGPVNSTKLDHTLRSLGIDTVVVTGLVTDVCVAQTAREFGDRDFQSLVVEDACATLGETHHRAALETIAITFGRVLSTAQVLALLESHAA
jgi:nicotinamidase-related amidase